MGIRFNSSKGYALEVAPSWTDDTGDAITGTVGTAIADVIVPAVDAGTPDPTYAQVGTVPASRSTPRRAQSASTKTPLRSAAAPSPSGRRTARARTIGRSATRSWLRTKHRPFCGHIRATRRAWTVGTAITSITIPRASGNPNPTYQLVSSPAGINVSLPTTGADGAITGTPTARRELEERSWIYVTLNARSTLRLKEDSANWRTLRYSTNHRRR